MVKVMMVKIENHQACFVQLWRRLERTRLLLMQQHRRFCIRNVLKLWLGVQATDEFIWQVCNRTIVGDEQVCGNDMLPLPSLYPRKHREFLRAVVSVSLGLKAREVKLPELDAAYSVVFPNSTALNINKKGKKVKK